MSRLAHSFILNRRAALLLAVAVITALFVGVTAFYANIGTAFLVLLIIAWALLYASLFRTDIFLSLVLGFITHFTITIVTFTALLPFGLRITVQLLVLAHVLVLVFAWLILLYRRGLAVIRIPHFTAPAVISSVVLLVTCIIMIMPFMKYGGIGSPGYLSIGEDNISHFALHNSVVQNQSFLYRISNDAAGVNHNLKAYPHGYHANLAANSIVIYGDSPRIDEVIKSHTVQIVSHYALLAALVSYLMTAGILRNRKVTSARLLVAISATVLVTYFGSFGFMLYLFTYGFHTQIAATALLLLLLAVAARTLDRRSSEVDTNWLMAISIALVILLTAYTWYFMLPVAATYGLAWVIKNWTFIKANLGVAFGAVIIVAVLAFIPVAYDTFRPHDSSSILLPGAIWLPQPLVLFSAAVLLGLFYCIYIGTIKKESSDYRQGLMALLSACLLFTIAIGAYMAIKIGRLEYYFFKSEYEALILVLVATGYSLGVLLDRTTLDLTRTLKLCLASLFLLSSVALCFVVQPLTYVAAFVDGELPAPLHSPYVERALNDSSSTAYYIRPVCKSLPNYITQRWIQAVELTESKEQTALNLSHVYFAGEEDLSKLDEVTSRGNAITLPSITCDP